MADLQATIEFAVELHKFYNIDLFQRGYYQIRASFKCNSKYPYKSEVSLLNHENETDLTYPSQLISGVAVSKRFKILYRKEDVDLDDRLLITCFLLVDSHRIVDCIEETDFVLVLELYFSEEEFEPFNQQLVSVCERSLHLHPGPTLCLQQSAQVMFDYFHLSMVTLSVHGALLSLYQPYASLVAQMKQKNKAAPEPASFESVLFSTKSSQPVPMVQHPRLWYGCRTHRMLAQILLRAYSGLQAALTHAATLLPQHSPLATVEEVDITEKLERLCDKVQKLSNEDDMAQVALTHIAQLSAELVVLWHQLQSVIAECPALEILLCKERHKQRVSRFCEASFVQQRSKVDVMSMYDPKINGHGRQATEIRSSPYLRLLPSLGVECIENDGRASELPLIFEDVYSDEVDEIAQPASEATTLKPEELLAPRSPRAPRERSVIQEVKPGTLQRPSAQRYAEPQQQASGVQLTGFTRITDVEADTQTSQVPAVIDYTPEPLNKRRSRRSTSGSLPDITQDAGPETLHELKASRARQRMEQFRTCLKTDTEDTQTTDVSHTPSDASSLASHGSKKDEDSVASEEIASGVDPSQLNGLIIDPGDLPSTETTRTDDWQPSDVDGTSSSQEQQGSKRYTLLELLKEEQERSDRQQQQMFRTWSIADELGQTHTWVASAAGLRVSSSSPNLLRAASSPAASRQHTHTVNKQTLKQSIVYEGLWRSDVGASIELHPYMSPTTFSRYNDEPLHLVICVHGLDGNQADLRLVRTFLELGLPNARFEFLMSERNQKDTFSDITVLTDRLVQEILYYINSFEISPDKISFVGHSLGNIIIRCATLRPELSELRSKFWTFLSLSGPHLGTIYGTSNLVNMGMWIMQKWKKSESLAQLSMKDHADPRRTFLYKLSQQKGLELFKNVLLVGSPQDKYVPYHSTRIEMCKAAYKDSVLGGVYQEMVVHLLSPVLVRSDCRLVRYDVFHALPSSSTNSLIGRAAHIAVLDSEIFLEKFFLTSALKYFT